MTAMGYGGTFVAFTFLAPILEQVTGLSSGSVALVLLVWGAFSFGNNFIGDDE